MTKRIRKKLALPDAMVQRKLNGALEKSVSLKGTRMNQIRKFNSNHPDYDNKICVKALFNRISTHCSSMQAAQDENIFFSSFSKENDISETIFDNAFYIYVNSWQAKVQPSCPNGQQCHTS